MNRVKKTNKLYRPLYIGFSRAKIINEVTEK